MRVVEVCRGFYVVVEVCRRLKKRLVRFHRGVVEFQIGLWSLWDIIEVCMGLLRFLEVCRCLWMFVMVCKGFLRFVEVS